MEAAARSLGGQAQVHGKVCVRQLGHREAMCSGQARERTVQRRRGGWRMSGREFNSEGTVSNHWRRQETTVGRRCCQGSTVPCVSHHLPVVTWSLVAMQGRSLGRAADSDDSTRQPAEVSVREMSAFLFTSCLAWKPWSYWQSPLMNCRCRMGRASLPN